jgi:hypothetical protein
MSQSQRPDGASGAPAGPERGLDPVNWEILCAVVTAAHDGNVAAAQAATRRFDTDVPIDGQAGTYLRYLLRHRIVDILGGRPSEEDLQVIAARAYLRFNLVIRGSERLLENVLRTVFRMPVEGEKVTGGAFIVVGTAALGVLLDDPVADMEAMRPHLADWWRRNLEKFRAWGVLDDRSVR